MDKTQPDRHCLEQYLHYQTMISRPGWAWTLSVAQLLAIVAAIYLELRGKLPFTPETTGKTLLTALILAGGVFIVTALIKFVILQLHKRLARRQRKSDLERLEADVRQVLKSDYKRALKQMVRRAAIRPAHLREIGNAYRDPLEHHLFTDDELRRFLGSMAGQSLRMATPYGPEPSFAAIASDRLLGRGLFNAYFFPVRLICLFFTNEEIILGECVFDSRTGDMVTRVKRLPETRFCGLETSVTQSRKAIPADRLRRWLSEHQFTPQEEKTLALAIERYEKKRRNQKGKPKRDPESPYVLDRTERYLLLSQDSGETLALPMRFQHALVRSKGMKPHLAANIPFPLAAAARAERTSLPEDLSQVSRPVRRRVSFMEYRTRWTLLAELAGGALAAGICAIVLSALAGQGALVKTSTDNLDVEVERNGVAGPRILDLQRLPEELARELADVPNTGFACVKVTTSLRERPSWKAPRLAQVQQHTAMLVLSSGLPGTTALPPGWSAVKTKVDNTILSGFVARDVLLPQPTTGPLFCPSRQEFRNWPDLPPSE